MNTIRRLFKLNICILVLSLILIFIIYTPLLKADFLSLDDKAGIINNPQTYNMKSAIRSMYTDPIINSLTFKLFGLSKVAFHIKGVLFHAVNTYLIFLITQYIIGKKSAILAMLFFAVHPGVSESVSWLSGHTYLYSAMFNLSALLFFIRYRKENRVIHLIFAVFIYILFTLFNRSPWILITPFIIFWVDYIFFSKKIINNKSFIFLLPMMLYILLVLPAMMSERTESLTTYLAGTVPVNKFVAIGYNIEKSFTLLLFPLRLSISTPQLPPTLIDYVVSILFYILLFIIFFISYKKDKIIFGLIGLIYISILPLFSPINIAVNRSERYYYLAIGFFCIIAAYLFVNKFRKLIGSNYPAVIFVILLLFGIRTFVRAFDWRTDFSLWASEEKAISSNYNVYNEMGNVYFAKNDLSMAMQYYEKALDIRPKYPTAIHNVGLIYLKLNRIEEAQIYFEKAVAIDANFYDSYYRLGQIAKYYGDIDEAKMYFQKALKIKNDFVEAQVELNKL